MAPKNTKQKSCCDPSLEPAFDGDCADDLAALAKAIGHPARVRILSLLVEKGVCISGDLAEDLPLAPSTVSEHLRILREAGLIRGAVDGPRRSYCVDNEVLAYFRRLVMNLSQKAEGGLGYGTSDC